MSSKGPDTNSQETSAKSVGTPSVPLIPAPSAPVAIVPGFTASASKPMASSAPTPKWVPGYDKSLSGPSEDDGIALFGSSPAQPRRRRIMGI